MSPPFFLGDLTACPRYELTMDGITNFAIDGVTDFLVGRDQLEHLDQFRGLDGTATKTFWYRFGPRDPVPARKFAGYVLAASTARALAQRQPQVLEGKRLIVEPDGTDLASLACRLQEAGAAGIAVAVVAPDAARLLELAGKLHRETGLPLHLVYQGHEDLETASLALGLLLERGTATSLSAGEVAGQTGSGFAKSLFNALELRRFGINYVSCPTCGRCGVDLEAITNQVKARTKDIEAPLTVAIMGCEVNGPGEARHADIGIAAGTESGLLIQDGKAVAKFKESELVDQLVTRVRAMAKSKAAP